ncbi:Cpr47Ed [Drosophila busckii]|uniref:Cpr47Ed n=1 Tax=Drosophila busckii TaxID=30019 RepID=A0A0M5J769_DROBS|nr:larval cuticle protein 1 [Drosophila busckii]ALC41474.1 Cpr47Ed [Drosophila busckii]
MYALLVLLALSCCSSSGLAKPQELIPIIQSMAEQKNDGSYFFAYEGADGSYREEVGIVRRSSNNILSDGNVEDAEDADAELEVSGIYRYTDSQGERVEVSYKADKNGFVPLGTNIPRQITETARNAVEALEVRVKPS